MCAVGVSVSGVESLRRAKDLNARSEGVLGAHPLVAEAVPSIAILMCTLNGARFLPAQLASLERQTFQNWRLFISDDGSTDDTLTILRSFAQRQPQRRRDPDRTQPRPFSLNFLSLAADRKIDADYFAFCDQDDVWHPTKLERAVTQLCAAPEHLPAVYGGRTRLVATDGKPFGHSHRFSKPPSFANALAQSIAGANTMLLNRAAKRLLERAGPLNVVSHDWWTYQLVVGSGGVFLYDREPHLDYRQHEANCIGCNRGLAAQWKRFRMVLNGGFGRWNNINLQALQQSRHLLTPEARARLDAYETMRNSPWLNAYEYFGRQTFAVKHLPETSRCFSRSCSENLDVFAVSHDIPFSQRVCTNLPMGMKVLVTGGAGFIGSAVCRRLIEKTDADVFNVDKLTYAANLSALHAIEANPRYHFYHVDICDRPKLLAIVNRHRPDAIIHLAAKIACRSFHHRTCETSSTPTSLEPTKCSRLRARIGRA